MTLPKPIMDFMSCVMGASGVCGMYWGQKRKSVEKCGYIKAIIFDKSICILRCYNQKNMPWVSIDFFRKSLLAYDELAK